MSYENFTILDTETIAIEGLEKWIEPSEAPANYKDPAKIAAYVAEDKQKRIAKAATDVDLARIVCLGALWSGGEFQQTDIYTAFLSDGTHSEELEHKVIGLALNACAADAVIGFHLSFDLSLILRRAQLLGYPGDLPEFRYSRYRDSELVWPVSGFRTQVVDLEQVLTFYGAVQGRSLDWYCRRFNIPCDDVVDGADIQHLWDAGYRDQIVAHCRADVAVRTKGLAERLGIIKPVTPVAA